MPTPANLPTVELSAFETIELRMAIAIQCWEKVLALPGLQEKQQYEKIASLYCGDPDDDNSISHVDKFINAFCPYEMAFDQESTGGTDSQGSPIYRYLLKENIFQKDIPIYAGVSIKREQLLRKNKKSSTTIVNGQTLHRNVHDAIKECRKMLKHAKDFLNNGELPSGNDESDLLFYVRDKMYAEYCAKGKKAVVVEMENEANDDAEDSDAEDTDVPSTSVPDRWYPKGWATFCLWVCPKVKIITDDLICMTISASGKSGNSRTDQRNDLAKDKKEIRDNSFKLLGPRGMDLESSIKIGVIAERTLQRYDAQHRDNFAILTSKVKLAISIAEKMSNAKSTEEMSVCPFWMNVTNLQNQILDYDQKPDETIDSAKMIVSSLMLNSAQGQNQEPPKKKQKESIL